MLAAAKRSRIKMNKYFAFKTWHQFTMLKRRVEASANRLLRLRKKRTYCDPACERPAWH